jgi:protein-S-isoprenylcysteine O-methyltransferase Ste14
MAVLPSIEYAKKQVKEKVGVKNFLKKTFYLYAPYAVLVANMEYMRFQNSLPTDTTLFSSEAIGNFGKTLSNFGHLTWTLSFAHLYGTQIGDMFGGAIGIALDGVKKGVKKLGTTLVTSLGYGLARNPLYLGVRAVSLGNFLYKPTLTNAALCALMFLTTELTARGEESYLETMWGKRYVEYKKRVPRWIPKPKGIMEMIKNPKMIFWKMREDFYYSILLREKSEMPKEKFEKLLEKLRKDDPFVPEIPEEL